MSNGHDPADTAPGPTSGNGEALHDGLHDGVHEGLHDGAPPLLAGRSLTQAGPALVLVHGRGGSAEDMFGLARAIGRERFALIAPRARRASWYPYSFLAPLASNEPWLSSALDALGRAVAKAVEHGVPAERIVLLGFSQGACLASEYVARNPRRYGGLVALSGGLIGPDGTPRDYPGDLDGTPVFLGCSDVDPHIPVERVHETARVLQGMGAALETRIYRGMAHTVAEDEIEAARALLDAVP